MRRDLAGDGELRTSTAALMWAGYTGHAALTAAALTARPWCRAASQADPPYRRARYHRRMPMTVRTAGAAGAAGVDEAAALAPAACLFRSLGDPARLSILRHLALGEHRVVDLTAHLGLAQSTVSGHLACLRDCGLVSSRPQGRASVFSLARPELLDVLGAAERLLAATGDAVVLCPIYGQDSGQ